MVVWNAIIKSKLSSSLHEPVKDQKRQYQVIYKAKILEDFWTSSTCGMDRSVGKSQEINLSVSTSTLTHDSHATANPNNPAEFVNHGKFDSPL